MYCPTLLLWLDTFMLCAKPKPNTTKKKKSNPNQISTPNQNAFPICKSKSKKNQKIYKKSYVSTREFVVSSGARSHLGKSKTKHLKKKRKHRRTIFWVLQTRKKKKTKRKSLLQSHLLQLILNFMFTSSKHPIDPLIHRIHLSIHRKHRVLFAFGFFFLLYICIHKITHEILWFTNVGDISHHFFFDHSLPLPKL